MLRTIVGKRGRGKTSLAAEIIAAEKRDRIFIYDYTGDFGQFAVDDSIVVERNSGSFSSFMVRAWNESAQVGSTLLVLDEIAVYGKNNPQIDHVYRLGRHQNMDILAISQRFASLPVITRSQTDVYHIFQITEARDIQHLRGLVSDDIIRTIISLQSFQYINISL